MNRIINYWQTRSQREQQILVYALPVIVILVVVIILKPILLNYRVAQSDYQSLQANYDWLHAQASITSNNNVCSFIKFNEDDDFLEQSLKQIGVSDMTWQKVNKGRQLTVVNGEGEKILNWLEKLPCYGVIVHDIEITQVHSLTEQDVDATKFVNATIFLEQLK